MTPSWTDVQWPPATPIVSLAEARKWIGIYGDTSVDEEVQVALNSAIEKVADFVGNRVSDTVVIDYFMAGFNYHLVLSEPGIDRDTITVKYYRRSDNALTTVDSSKWFLDPTSKRNVVVWTDDGYPSDVTDDLDYPITVTYTTKLENVRGGVPRDRIRYAVRLVTNWYWQSRGQVMDPVAVDKSLTSLLHAVRGDVNA